MEGEILAKRHFWIGTWIGYLIMRAISDNNDSDDDDDA